MIKPLGKRVLVKQPEVEEVTASGIIIPDSLKEKPNNAEIVAVSKEIEDLKIGDKILLSKYGGSTVKVDDNEYLIVEYNDILGVY